MTLRLAKSRGRGRVKFQNAAYCVCLDVFFVLVILATRSPIASAIVPKQSSKKQSGKQAVLSPLGCITLQVSSSQIILPALDTTASLTLQNDSKTPVLLIKSQLSFLLQSAIGRVRDVSRQIYCEPDENNPWFVPSGGTVQLKFKVQFLHDTPAGTLHVRPNIQYFSQSDNAFPPVIDYGKTIKSWQVENPTALFNARATFVKNETATTAQTVPPGGSGSVLLSVNDNRLKGRITLQSPKSPLRPNTDYVAGVLYKSDRSGWDSPINKGAAVTEFDATGAVRAHPLHLFEVPYWSWELARFKSNEKASQVAMSVWNRGWALKQKGESWYSTAFVVPADKLRVLRTVAQEPVVTIAATYSPTIAFLGDDRPKAGEDGDWIGRYGNESFILCGMQAPQDVVGGRLLPKRRWAQGKDGLAPTSPVWTDWKGEFFYEVLTGDPNEPPRHWIPRDELTTKDPRGLINPLEGGRRYAAWDDRGEVHPFDNKGPDLIVNLEIPQGLHRLTLYFIDWDFYNTSRPRAHRLFFSDGTKDEKAGLLSSGYVSDFGQGVYKVYGVSGPSKLRLRIQKDKSVCAVLSGIFLDEINLPNIQRILPKDRRSVALRQAVQEWEELRQLQSTPTNFLASGERMKQVLRLANQVVRSDSKEEKAVAEWLRWQVTSSLVVAPWVRKPAFLKYIAARPAVNAATARVRVRWLLEAGNVGLARQATKFWLQTERKESPATELAALREAMVWFAQRDTNFACILAQFFVKQAKAQHIEPQAVSDDANKLRIFAQMQAEGSLPTRNAYRVVASLYRALEKEFNETLDDTDAFRLAEAMANTPGYYLMAEKRGVEAYRKYLQIWPKGKHMVTTHKRIISLVNTLVSPTQENARQYASLAAESAQVLLARYDNNSEGYRLVNSKAIQPNSDINDDAFEAVHRIAEIFNRVGDKQEAEKWRAKVIARIRKGHSWASQTTEKTQRPEVPAG